MHERIFALSDVHIEHPANRAWIEGLSRQDYRCDTLLLAGDVSDSLSELSRCLTALTARFRHVVYVPGNHDLWVIRDPSARHSFHKLEQICAVANDAGVSMATIPGRALTIVPLFSWYDYSFGAPSAALRAGWADYRTCRWPFLMTAQEVCEHFLRMNEPLPAINSSKVITFSHFLPRPDLLRQESTSAQFLRPVMGCTGLDKQIRHLGSTLHVYGHSHRNGNVVRDGIRYVNQALGYPAERGECSPTLCCIHELIS
jgi:predicted phosphodiesterase